MPELKELLDKLSALDAKEPHDYPAMRAVREQIIEEHGTSEAAVEALYKVGLDVLFHERNLDLAVERFEAAAKRKVPFWSDAARTSLGLCYFHQRRSQKALLELRKVAYPDKPTTHSVTALSFIEMVYESDGKRDEAKRVRKDRIHQLEQLCKTTKVASERGHYLFQLGIACRDHGDDTRAQAALADAKALGPDVLGADLFRSVVEALA